MKKESLDTYVELEDRDGFKTFFRKFDEATWIFQFNENDEYVGSVCVSSKVMESIANAPSVKAGDGKTPQTL